MSVITFWSNGKEETGKTMSIVAIATYMAIEHNYKILVLSTSYNNKKMERCFWQDKKTKKNLGIFGPNTNVTVDDGIVGVTRALKSNRLSPENIKNYTKAIFKDRLEILSSYTDKISNYEEVKEMYPDIINLANQYYDLVFVDLNNSLEERMSKQILEKSNLIVANLTQRLTSINEFIELREKELIFKSNKTLILIGRYDKFSKYTIKNISRYMGEKNKISTIPYNTLFFEACEESTVPDLFLKLRKVDKEDRNAFFMEEIKRTSENIIYRLQALIRI